jgi:hypothetical protein
MGKSKVRMTKFQTYLQRMQALCDFPPAFSDGWKNASTSLVLSLSETFGASGSESSDDSSALGAAVACFSVIH